MGKNDFNELKSSFKVGLVSVGNRHFENGNPGLEKNLNVLLQAASEGINKNKDAMLILMNHGIASMAVATFVLLFSEVGIRDYINH